jgi:hypothetical protein
VSGFVVVARPGGFGRFAAVFQVVDVATQGLVNQINQIAKELGDPRISNSDRAVLENELFEASRLLDRSENYEAYSRGCLQLFRLTRRRRVGDSAYATTGFSHHDIVEICAMIHRSISLPAEKTWPPSLGLFRSVAITLS